MLLYVRRLHFRDVEEAIADWNRGNLDALVAPNDRVPELLSALTPPARISLQSEPRGGEERTRYSLLVRQ